MSSVMRFDEWQDSNGVPVLDGTNLAIPSGALPAGTILQVVHANTTTQTSTTSTSFVNTSLSATITPSSTSSKILIQVQLEVVRHRNTADATLVGLFRGTVSGTKIDSNTFVYFDRTGINDVGQNLLFFDSPNTTSAQTYTVGLRTLNASNTAGVAGQQNIVLMEVAA
jgi:hypothetical protein